MRQRFQPRVTVAAVIERNGRFLLIEEETSDGLRLNNPAGHLDPGEAPAEGCARETLEETAHRFTPTALVGVYLSRSERPSGEDVTYIRFAYCGDLGALEPERPLDTGIVRTLWLTAQEIRDSAGRHRSPLVVRCVEDYLAGRRYPLSAVFCDSSVYSPPVGINRL